MDLPNVGTVWYHPQCIANIMSLAMVKKEFRVIYASENGNIYCVHMKNNTVRKFHKPDKYLFYSDICSHDVENIFVSSVEFNKRNYSNHDYFGA